MFYTYFLHFLQLLFTLFTLFMVTFYTNFSAHLLNEGGVWQFIVANLFPKKPLHKKEDDLALKDKQSVPKGRRPLPILNTNFSNKENKFTNTLGDYVCIATFFLRGVVW